MRRRTFLVGGAALGLLAACGDSERNEPPSRSPLPPNDRDELASIFDPRLHALGLRITRAGLYEPDDAYRRSGRGTHLALYAEPADGEPWDAARYLDNIVPSAAATLPHAFATWSGLTSADLCQEPMPSGSSTSEGDPAAEAFVTQVAFDRSTGASIDWDTVDLTGLIAVAVDSPSTARVIVDAATKRHSAWATAFDAAQAASDP